MKGKVILARSPYLIASLCLIAASAQAQSVGEPGCDGRGPNPLRNVYFGEQHLHTENSPDAFVVGTRGTWEDAYNYAMGKPTPLSTTGEMMQKGTPYDFVAITDHAEYFGVMPSLIDPNVRTLYYVRVLEIPTPRWSTYDSVRSKIPLPPNTPLSIQERAWSSPIWYTPASPE